MLSLRDATLFDSNDMLFYDGLADLIRKSSSDLSVGIISQLWELCRVKLVDHGDESHAIKWLSTIAGLLKDIRANNTAMMSPRTCGMIRLFVVHDVFQLEEGQELPLRADFDV